MKTLSPLFSSSETALDRKKQEWYLKGYDEGMIAGELKSMARIKASIGKYIDEQQKLYDTTEDGKKIVGVANQVIKAFNYDDSNAQVDYFDTNFYYNLKVEWK